MKLQEMKERIALAWRIVRGRDDNSVAHACREFETLGYYDGDKMNLAMADGVIDLLRTFSTEGHSGFSASYARQLFAKLAAFEPLGPLTGADSEWFDHGDDMGLDTRWQNKRCGHVFKSAAGRSYDSNAVVFEDSDGSRFTGRHSRQFVSFPYEPRSVVCLLPENCTDVQREMLAAQAWAKGI